MPLDDERDVSGTVQDIDCEALVGCTRQVYTASSVSPGPAFDRLSAFWESVIQVDCNEIAARACPDPVFQPS